MIKKVAEHQVLRMAWQDVFKGTYGDAEQWKATDNGNEPPAIEAEIVGPAPQPPTTVPEDDAMSGIDGEKREGVS